MSGKKRKIFVLDTNVLIHKPDAILSFKNSDVIIPIWVLEELDKLKTFSGEKGRVARAAIRFLDACSKGNFNLGYKIAEGIVVYISLETKPLSGVLSSDKMDNKIIGCALYQKSKGKQEVFFVSKDINARVKAKTLGLNAVDYDKQKVEYGTLYSGYKEIQTSEDFIRDLYSNGEVETDEPLFPNQFIIYKTKSGEDVLCQYESVTKKIKLLPEETRAMAGIRPLNMVQRMAVELLLNPNIKLITLVGKAGTGKTLLAIAAGLKYIFEKREYSKVLVSRPVIPMGNDIGYLPGDKKNKLSSWMQPIFDNFDFILSRNQESNNQKIANIKSIDSLISQNVLEIEALTYMRGRSLPNQFIIVDEAQNLSPHEIKTVVSRAGKGTKVVLTGDPQQIDNPYLDADSNGLTFLVEAFKGQEIFGHILLNKSERSELAELAAELL